MGLTLGLFLLLGLAACVQEQGASPLREVTEADTSSATTPSVRTTRGFDGALLDSVYARASELPRLRSLLIARHGELFLEEYFAGTRPEDLANIKSASKSVISALVGIAIAEGELEGVDQPVLPFFKQYLGEDADPQKREITIGHLLSMQSGLRSTSSGRYGEWVSSSNWIQYAITQPMVDEPGGRMQYSTGSSHLLSAILTEATGQSTLEYMREKLAEPLSIELRPWTQDPQGIFLGGNNMHMRPREMLRFGELYRKGGRWEGQQLLPVEWIETSWTPRTRSRYSGHRYGYGWWFREMRGHRVHFAWGHGGQFIFVVPSLELTVVATSAADTGRGGGHLDAVHDLVAQWIIPAAEQGA